MKLLHSRLSIQNHIEMRLLKHQSLKQSRLHPYIIQAFSHLDVMIFGAHADIKHDLLLYCMGFCCLLSPVLAPLNPFEIKDTDEQAMSLDGNHKQRECR